MIRLRRARKIAFAMVLVGGGLLVLALLLEMVLAAGFLDGRDDPEPVYIPARFKAVDFAINRDNHAIARKNPLYCNDVPRNMEKPEKTLRIAVIGDSFIWGDGAPYDTIWSHKLEKIISSHYSNVEVVSFGQNGWSTQDERDFLLEDGFRYSPDVVVVGCLANDLSSYFHPELRFFWEGGRLESALKVIFPRTVDYLTSYLKRFYEARIDRRYDYASALESLYTPERLAAFSKVVKDLKRLCDERHVGLVFVLTPDAPSPENREFFGKLGEVFLAAGVNSLDLFPAVDQRFSETNPRLLWANPANRHPGDLLTQLYAEEVYRYLKKTHYLVGAKAGARPVVGGREALVRALSCDVKPLSYLGRAGSSGVMLEAPADLTAAAASKAETAVMLFEDGAALKRVADADAAGASPGSFAVSGRALVFSAADRSDPLANGKVYRVELPEKKTGFYIHIRDKKEELRLTLGDIHYGYASGAVLSEKAAALERQVAEEAQPQAKEKTR